MKLRGVENGVVLSIQLNSLQLLRLLLPSIYIWMLPLRKLNYSVKNSSSQICSWDLDKGSVDIKSFYPASLRSSKLFEESANGKRTCYWNLVFIYTQHHPRFRYIWKCSDECLVFIHYLSFHHRLKNIDIKQILSSPSWSLSSL